MEKAEAYREQMIEAMPRHDDDLMHKFIEGEAITDPELKKSLRKSDHRAKDLPGNLRHGFQEQRCPDHAGRGGGLPALAAGHSAHRRRRSDHPEKVVIRKPADSEPFSALVFKMIG